MNLPDSSAPRSTGRPRLHPRHAHPQVEADSPLIDCRLLDLSAAGVGFETSVGLRLGIPYPIRLRDGDKILSTEAVIRWCRWVRNDTVDGEARPVYRAGASFVDWKVPDPPPKTRGLELQIDTAVDSWIARSRTGGSEPVAQRKIVRHDSHGRPR